MEKSAAQVSAENNKHYRQLDDSEDVDRLHVVCSSPSNNARDTATFFQN